MCKNFQPPCRSKIYFWKMGINQNEKSHRLRQTWHWFDRERKRSDNTVNEIDLEPNWKGSPRSIICQEWTAKCKNAKWMRLWTHHSLSGNTADLEWFILERSYTEYLLLTGLYTCVCRRKKWMTRRGKVNFDEKAPKQHAALETF